MPDLDLANALLGAVVGLGLQWTAVGANVWRQSRHQELSGVMYQTIPPSGGKGLRHDIYRIRQSGQRLQGRAERVYPSSESTARWKMTGYSHGNTVVFSFYPSDPKRDASSYGAAVLHRNPNITDCAVWQGYYARPGMHGFDAITNAEVARYPLLWQRCEWGTHSHLSDLYPQGGSANAGP